MKKEKKDEEGNKKQKTIRQSEDKRMEQKLIGKKKEMSTDFDTGTRLVIDLGNSTTKIGYAGNDQPTIEVPSIMAKNNNSDDKKGELLEFDKKKNVFGYEALDDKYMEYELTYLTPGDHKSPTSEEYKDFLQFILEKQMQLTPSDYNAIINISPIINRQNVNFYIKLFFDDIQFKSIAIVNNASLSLFSTGRTSGTVVQCGERRSYVVPIYEGFPLRHALRKNSVGGEHLTEIFKNWIDEQDYCIKSNNIKILREIKEKTCFVPYEFPYDYYLKDDEIDIISGGQKLFKLPDDTIITVPKDCRLNASELLFK